MSLDPAETIDLAHTPPFAIGRITVRPGVRQLVRDDGEQEVLEPRVMQVLVALARASGEIVSRDDLTRSCWDNRVVGEDAINRVISRLRRSAENIGEGTFKIETITKVGYRLLQAEAPAASQTDPVTSAPAAPAGPTAARKPSRRAMMIGGVNAVAASGLAFYLWRHRKPAIAPEAADRVRQGFQALRQDRESQDQAIGLFQSAVAIQPDYADGWGALAIAYTFLSHWRAPQVVAQMRRQGGDAARRAEALDPDNAFAAVARAYMLPTRGNWIRIEMALRTALRDHPDNGELLYALANLLATVGRFAECLPLMEACRKNGPPSALIYFNTIMMFWAADRLADADRLSDEASKLFPRQFAIWFARVYIAMYSGRLTEALALIDDEDGRPVGIPVQEFGQIAQVAHAMQSRAPSDIDAVMTTWMRFAHEGSGYAENSIQFGSALGRLDDAFDVANAFYFNKPFVVPALRFSPEQAIYTPIEERQTSFLFLPSTVAMRQDARFDPLMKAIGLEDYWKKAGVQPDFRKT